jgi:hypothetical protein
VASQELRREEKRARAIASMGRVERDECGFTVYSAARIPEPFRVWEEAEVGFRCTCEAFNAAFRAGSVHECEHILAVALWLSPPEDEVQPREPIREYPPLRRIV